MVANACCWPTPAPCSRSSFRTSERLTWCRSGPRLGFIQTELGAENLPLDRFGVLNSRHVVLAKTESRTVLGYMNEMARFCEYAIDDSGGLAKCNARELNRELRRELHLSRQPPGYFVSIELAGRSRDQPRLRVVD
jgi:hypothetical protein